MPAAKNAKGQMVKQGKQDADRPYYYNVQGAAEAIGKSWMTTTDAIDAGELVSCADVRGGERKGGGTFVSRLVSPQALSDWRDLLVRRHESYVDEANQTEARRLKKLRF